MESSSELALVWPPDGPEPGASLRVSLAWGVETHQGLQAAINTDYYLLGRFQRGMQTLATNMPRGSMPDEHGEAAYGVVLADGIGHARMSEVASRTAVATLVDLVLGTPDWILRVDDVFRKRVTGRMGARMRWVDNFLAERRDEMPAFRQTGATLTGVIIHARDLLIAHVGRSRVYHWRAGQLTQLTTDHERALALGAAHGDLAVDLVHRRLEDGDRVVLCTDGLVESVPDAALAAMLEAESEPQAAAGAIINRAVKGGAPDDVTAIVLHYHIAA